MDGWPLGTKVAACGDSALRDAANATVHVVQARKNMVSYLSALLSGENSSRHFGCQEFHGHTVLRFPCEKSRADVDVIVMMEILGSVGS